MNLSRWTGLATAVVVIGLAAGAPPAQAETTSGSLDDFNLTSWTEANGLPPGRIRDLIQDAAGYLWIASDSGLVGTPNHPDAMAMAIKSLRGAGFSEPDLNRMFKETPARLVGLPVQ